MKDYEAQEPRLNASLSTYSRNDLIDAAIYSSLTNNIWSSSVSSDCMHYVENGKDMHSFLKMINCNKKLIFGNMYESLPLLTKHKKVIIEISASHSLWGKGSADWENIYVYHSYNSKDNTVMKYDLNKKFINKLKIINEGEYCVYGIINRSFDDIVHAFGKFSLAQKLTR